jgi:hypothetical protein
MTLEPYIDTQLCKVCWDTKRGVKSRPCPACGLAAHSPCSNYYYLGQLYKQYFYSTYSGDYDDTYMAVCIDCAEDET